MMEAGTIEFRPLCPCCGEHRLRVTLWPNLMGGVDDYRIEHDDDLRAPAENLRKALEGAL